MVNVVSSSLIITKGVGRSSSVCCVKKKKQNTQLQSNSIQCFYSNSWIKTLWAFEGLSKPTGQCQNALPRGWRHDYFPWQSGSFFFLTFKSDNMLLNVPWKVHRNTHINTDVWRSSYGKDKSPNGNKQTCWQSGKSGFVSHTL